MMALERCCCSSLLACFTSCVLASRGAAEVGRLDARERDTSWLIMGGRALTPARSGAGEPEKGESE